MKKTIFLICAGLLIMACTQKATPVESTTNEAKATATTLNAEFIAKDGSQKLLGPVNSTGLSKDPYSEWFSKGEKYKADQTVLDALNSSLEDYSITAFFGTWCGDSKKHVPSFYKVLEGADFDMTKLQVIAVDNVRTAYKKSPSGEEKGLNIHRVPTFIFYKEGQEVGRIVESPKETLEKDMLKITSTADYTENYSVVSDLDRLIRTKGIGCITEEKQELISKYTGNTKSLSELNTYARTYIYDGFRDEGIQILQLNQALHPNEDYPMESLATILIDDKKYIEAETLLNTFLTTNPKSEKALALKKKLSDLMVED